MRVNMFDKKEYMKKYFQEHKKHLDAYSKEYRQTEKCKTYHRKYKQENPNIFRKSTKKYYQNHKDDCNKRVLENRQTKKGKQSYRKARLKYLKSEKGRMKDAKTHAKRKRNLQWIPLFDNPFDKLELIDWHHIDDSYVVAIPRDLHQLYNGNAEYHREKIKEIVKQIYGETKVKN